MIATVNTAPNYNIPADSSTQVSSGGIVSNLGTSMDINQPLPEYPMINFKLTTGNDISSQSLLNSSFASIELSNGNIQALIVKNFY